MVVQLEEVTYPTKETKIYKQRTEIVTKTSNPKFEKNLFIFPGLSYGKRQLLS